MFLLSQNIVLLISGDKFAGAETSLSILAVSLVFSALAIFYVSLVLIPLGKEKIILIATIVSAVANIVLNFILIPFWGRDAAALTTVISEVIMVVYGIIYSVKDYKFNIVRALISGIVASLGVAGLYFGTSFMGLGSVVQLFVCIAGAAVWYLLVMAVINKEDLKALVKTFKK
jgi:O-antigen/teichoic acid export membrane protein